MEEDAVKWRVTYAGPALDNHEMDVRELAPALLALADVFETMGAQIFGAERTMQVSVHGSFQTGSFGIDLTLARQLTGNLLSLLTSKGTGDVVKVSGMVDILYKMLEFFRKKGRRTVLTIEERPGSFEVLFTDKSTLPVEKIVAGLLQNSAVVAGIAKAVAPVLREGIDRVAFGTDRTIDAQVTKKEAGYIEPLPTPEELLTDREVEMLFSLLSVSFKEDNKWRVSDGVTSYFVGLDDPVFRERVDRGEPFAKGDLLVCRVHERQVNRGGRLEAERTILEVLEHRRALQQMTIFPEALEQDDGNPKT